MSPSPREKRMIIHVNRCYPKENIRPRYGQAGHRVSNCPLKGPPTTSEKVQVSHTRYNNYSSHPVITVSFLVSGSPVSQHILMDSGTDGNFMDSSLARTLRLGFAIAYTTQGYLSERFFCLGVLPPNHPGNHVIWRKSCRRNNFSRIHLS